GHLWSISVEELFYAIWPVLSKLPGKVLFRISLAIFATSLFLASYLTPKSWYNPFVQFLFFAEGYVIATWRHNRLWRPATLIRICLFVLGIEAWLTVQPIFRVLRPGPAEAGGFVASAAGCALIFLSILGMNVPRAIQPI